jgi:hypothetical protein
MRARRRPVAVICIGLIALAALVPGICALDHALVQPRFTLLIDEAPLPFVAAVVRCDEQPVSLAGLLFSRAPPLRPLA